MCNLICFVDAVTVKVKKKRLSNECLISVYHTPEGHQTLNYRCQLDAPGVY